MFTDLIMLAIASLNLAVISPTKLLHTNLKCILITQSVAVLIFGLDRSAIMVKKFIEHDLFMTSNVLLQRVLNFNAIFRRLLGHVLILERFLATFYIISYEKCPKLLFTLAWFSITFIIAVVNAITPEQPQAISNFNFKQIERASPNNYNIGLRYQISDNINTAKQLSATFLCFFLSNLLLTFLYIVITLNLVNEAYQISFVYACGNWSIAILCVATEFTIMTHHPLLKRRLTNLLNSIFCFRLHRVAPNSVDLPNVYENCENEMNDHFKMLQQCWNK
ncbi:hypothetical protein niasHS_013695 [Heterodera schachtii]|uniref:Gustatory receptor n=1 Tax=Heterodera schachtii TaxID=97005 RepID=A0ABD2IIX4_HETSC